jgi:colanic acid biosynthesis glycosyl transferase WcaI
MDRMRILFATQYYAPESNAPANRVAALARVWTELGASVEVLTGFPNHPEGRIYPGYDSRLPRREDHAGVSVLRVPIYAAANQGTVRRSLAYGSFCLSASTLGPLLSRPADVVVATSPQILTAVAGVGLATTKRAPFILEVRDLWPDSIVAVGALTEGHPVVRGLARLEAALYRRADHTVVVTEAFRRVLQERGVPADRLSCVPNGVDSELFRPLEEGDPVEPDPFPGRFVVTFAGTVGMAHGIGTMLDAARQLREARPDVLFVVAGSGAERVALEARVQSERLDNVRFVGRIPRADIPPLLRRSDLSLVMLRDSPLFRTVLPSKLFEAMGCARPILLGVDGEARRLVEEAGAGVFFPPGDPRALAASIIELAEDRARLCSLGRSGRDYALTHYDRRALAVRYHDHIREVVGRWRSERHRFGRNAG